jgi:hypothetical protein
MAIIECEACSSQGHEEPEDDDIDEIESDSEYRNKKILASRDKDKDKYKVGYKQWLIDGDAFFSLGETVQTLPSGFYIIKWSDAKHKYYLSKRDVLTEDLLMLPNENFNNIINDIKSFWNSKERYIKYNYIYKRGILLHGVPGCGKTSLINLITKDLIENQNGIVINIRQSNDIYAFDDIIKDIREIEPDRRIIAIFEDIDNFTSSNDKELQSKLLNILDGNLSCDNIINIATTNYPETLEQRFSNRPSRFDRNYEIELPDSAVRKFYIECKLSAEDLKTIDIDEWIESTEGFTLDHLKELLLSVFVLQCNFNDSLELMSNMMNTKIIKSKSGTTTMGFQGFKAARS